VSVGRAMVLAAGLGTRLLPLTEERPKPLLPLLDLLLLHFPLLLLRGAGIREVTLNLHHLGDQIRARLGDGSDLGLSIHYSDEKPRLLGTGGGIKRARERLDGGTFVVLNGDTLVDVDLPEVIAAHARSGAVATMLLADAAAERDFGVVRVDGDACVRDIAGRLGWKEGGRTGHFCGVHVLEPRIFDLMPEEEIFCINADVYPKLIAAGGRVHGCFLARAFHDVGTPARYIETAEALLDGRLRPAYAAEALAGKAGAFDARPGGIRIARSARVDRSAEIEGPLYVGPGAEVDAGAIIGPYAILGERARVGAGGRARHAILWEDASLPDGEVIERAVLTPRGRVAASV